MFKQHKFFFLLCFPYYTKDKGKNIQWICYSITGNREEPKESNKTSMANIL
ncbi:hypothetical protein BACDOR_02972 [Phocaeicola dorei DSM 17855]|uniref:Uncharacterized protein n=1 Tax=Phocaeicola dorei DSM 17855 TaxID=483217 RepID=B6W092_9BACT|nr:hypothetical protein BACDOR_02972 [Phocaeicola dorei DSM 17855]